MDPDVRTPIPIITFEVLGEQNCIFIEKSKRGPFLPLPLVIYFSEMDSFVFVQIASLCLSDKKDVSLYLTFHITTLTWAGGQQLGPSSLLECPAPLGRLPHSTRLSCCRSQCCHRDTARNCQTGGPHPHPLQTKAPTHPPEFQSHGHLYSTSHSSVGFSRMCSKRVLNGCLPNSHQTEGGAWPYKPAACHCLALRDLGRMQCRELVKDPGLMSTGLSPR